MRYDLAKREAQAFKDRHTMKCRWVGGRKVRWDGGWQVWGIERWLRAATRSVPKRIQEDLRSSWILLDLSYSYRRASTGSNFDAFAAG